MFRKLAARAGMTPYQATQMIHGVNNMNDRYYDLN
jgi:hypothetical protein